MMKRIMNVALCVLATATLSFSHRAEACPSNHYEACFLGGCGCLPSTSILSPLLPPIVTEPFTVTTGQALAAAIRATRSSNIDGSMPIPPNVRRQLEGYYDQGVLNRVRYKVGDAGALSVANLSMTYGNARAVTLDDLIIFSSRTDATTNSDLWAHELKHVQQFRDWGVEEFAISYARDFDAVEEPAYAAGNRFAEWRRSQPLGVVDRPGGRSWGGAYDQRGDVCAPQPNPTTGGCSCPTGYFPHDLQEAGLVMCLGPAELFDSNTLFFGGGYDVKGDRCAASNPLTAQCSCPSGYEPLDLSDAGAVICYRRAASGSAPISRIGGAYDMSGDECRVGNPASRHKCGCPIGFQAMDLWEAGFVICRSLP